MSLFSVIGAIARPLAKSGIIRGSVGKALGYRKPVQQSLPGVVGASVPMIMKRNIPAIGRKVGKALPGIAGGVAAGLALDRFGQPQKKKRRRINPCNDKALKRAVRRIEMYDKQRKAVDSALRKACPPARRRAAPSRRKC